MDSILLRPVLPPAIRKFSVYGGHYLAKGLSDVPLGEPYLVNPMNIGEFLCALLQENDGSRKAKFPLKEARLVDYVLPSTHAAFSSFILGGHDQECYGASLQHVFQDVADCMAGARAYLVCFHRVPVLVLKVVLKFSPERAPTVPDENSSFWLGRGRGLWQLRLVQVIFEDFEDCLNGLPVFCLHPND